MTRARLFPGSVIVALVAAGSWVGAASLPIPVTVEPRVLETTVDRVSLDEIEVSLRVGLRASRSATIRAIALTDVYADAVPVWIPPVDGDWPIDPSRELVIPRPMRVRIQARDAIGGGDFGTIIRRGSVRVRAVAEVSIATPWIGRLLFRAPTQTVVREIALDVAVPTPPAGLAPLARLGADLADAARRGGLPLLNRGLNRLPARQALLTRFGGAVAPVTASYEIAGAAERTRQQQATGVWWTPAVFCTTREAIEPWRFDVGDATALQLGGAHLVRDRGRLRIAATRAQPAVDVELAALGPVLPAFDERTVFTLVEGIPRRLRLGDRRAATNLVCLQLRDTPTPAAAPATAAAPRPPSGEVAAFATSPALGPQTLSLVWTGIADAKPDRLDLATPVFRPSFGSPLVQDDRFVGLVASSTTAHGAAAVDAAAAKARRVTPAAATGAAR
jgi:hypothetical protein